MFYFSQFAAVRVALVLKLHETLLLDPELCVSLSVEPDQLLILIRGLALAVCGDGNR